MAIFKKHHLKPIFVAVGVICWLSAIVVVIVPIFPYFLYRLSPQTPDILAANLAQTAADSSSPSQGNSEADLPPLDPNLSETNTLTIPSIGVNGEIHEGTDSETILRQGIWMVPDFATPESRHPVILASHRWGYLDWTNSFRRLNSFYSLPKTKVGDQVTINWNRRQYTYEIYKTENAAAITDYSADLILYTCELWNSPIRVFRYLKRI